MTGRPPQALIVEDEALWSSLLERLLKQEGISSVVAHDAAAARAFLRERSFDLVLLDLCLPDEDGLELLDDPQRHASLAHRCIVVSAHALIASCYAAALRIANTIPIVDKLAIDELMPQVRRVLRRD